MNFDRLLDVLGADTNTLVKQMAERVAKFGYDVQVSGHNHWIWCVPRRPDSHVCMVAHMDTIARKAFEPVRTGTEIRNGAKAVLGADDRAGVYAIWEILESGYRPYVLLTTGEEAMGIGVRDAIKHDILKDQIPRIKLFIELDRQGHDEYVYYSDRIPTELRDWAQQYGLHEDYGSYSDVCDLTRAYKVGHLNLSIGYMHQHTPSEVLDLVWLDAAVLRMCWMLHDGLAPKVILSDRDIDGAPFTPWVRPTKSKFGYSRTFGKSSGAGSATADMRDYLNWWEDDEPATGKEPPPVVEFCDYCLGDHQVEDCVFVAQELSQELSVDQVPPGGWG